MGFARDTRAARDRRKGTLANYRQSNHEKKKGIFAESKVVNQPTGKLLANLVDAQDQAKKYRRKDLADKACARLQKLYSDFDTKVSVKLEKGEAQ